MSLRREQFGEDIASAEFDLLKDFVDKGGRVLDINDGTEWAARDVAAIFGTVGSSESR